MQYGGPRADRNLIPAAGTLSRYHAIELHRHRAAQRIQPAVQSENAREYKTIARAKLEQLVQLSGFGAGEAALPVGKPFQRG